jgi:uncharacterized protein
MKPDLDVYIVKHLAASPGPVTNFSLHGGEPTLLGIDYFLKIVRLQRRHLPPDRRITNGIQNNGTRLDEDWCGFLSAEGFSVGISLDGPKDLHNRHRVSRTCARAINASSITADLLSWKWMPIGEGRPSKRNRSRNRPRRVSISDVTIHARAASA